MVLTFFLTLKCLRYSKIDLQTSYMKTLSHYADLTESRSRISVPAY
jgi:hypothetical protein